MRGACGPFDGPPHALDGKLAVSAWFCDAASAPPRPFRAIRRIRLFSPDAGRVSSLYAPKQRSCALAWLRVSLLSGVYEPGEVLLWQGARAAARHRPAAERVRPILRFWPASLARRAFRCLFFSWLAFGSEAPVSHKTKSLATAPMHGVGWLSSVTQLSTKFVHNHVDRAALRGQTRNAAKGLRWSDRSFASSLGERGSLVGRRAALLRGLFGWKRRGSNAIASSVLASV